MRPNLLDVQNVTKRFEIARSLLDLGRAPFQPARTICAVEHINLTVQSGEIVGLVGQNGAGKTTLIRILADLLEPDTGHVALQGDRYHEKKYNVRRNIGYVSSDERSFFWPLSGRDNLTFFARLYEVPQDRTRERIERLLDRFGLCDKASEPFRSYSSGTKKKFTLIRALLHEPNLLLLDEVTNSLDSESASSTKSMVREYVAARADRCALWSSHRLEEIGEICDKLLILDRGKVAYQGPASGFQVKNGHLSPLRDTSTAQRVVV